MKRVDFALNTFILGLILSFCYTNITTSCAKSLLTQLDAMIDNSIYLPHCFSHSMRFCTVEISLLASSIPALFACCR